ncbi:MAG: hypothetical protein ABEJ92_09505, partial [Halobacteriales archaeon]
EELELGADFVAFVDAVQGDCDVLIAGMSTLDELWETGQVASDAEGRTQEVLLGSLRAAGDMLAEVEALQAIVSARDSSASGTIAAAVSKLTGWLKQLKQRIKSKVSSKLWSVVSSLQSPDSWTITGDAGASLLGLSGTVGVEVTFS